MWREREEKDNVICGAPAFVSAAVYVDFRRSVDSDIAWITSCLRIYLITWHSSQARVPWLYQLFHIRTWHRSVGFLDLRSRRPRTAWTARRREGSPSTDKLEFWMPSMELELMWRPI